MNFSELYSSAYDSIYKDKNYHGEVLFLHDLFEHHSRRAVHSILDMGCGTGTHAIDLSKLGYAVTGVDQSASMLKVARKKIKTAGRNIPVKKGNLQTVSLTKKFDAVISMFAVMGYQTANNELVSAFKNIRKHLKKEGLFVFDGWFGPAVLANPPQSRQKVIQLSKEEKIVRHTKCRTDILAQTTHIEFTTKHYLKSKRLSHIKEEHLMRFFFPLEIEGLLALSGFKLQYLCPFMKYRGKLSDKTWNFSCVAIAD